MPPEQRRSVGLTAFPPVYSEIQLKAFVSALRPSVSGDTLEAFTMDRLEGEYPGRKVCFAENGTSALAIALSCSAEAPATRVALPAYCCPDVGAAAMFVGASIALYDLDPQTLEPDESSFRSALEKGCTHAIVSHLYGRILDVPKWIAIAAEYGVVLIEDAAQHAGGRLARLRAGGLADWGVLSFGRGKGLNAGGGGALLVRQDLATPDVLGRITSVVAANRSLGISLLLKAGLTELLSRPQIYGFVRNNKQLGIGQTRFRPLSELAPFSTAGLSLLLHALKTEAHEMVIRQRRAQWYREQLCGLSTGQFTVLPAESDGSLRFPLKWPNDRQAPSLADRLEKSGLASLGVVRSYPRTLLDYPELRGKMVPGHFPVSGAVALASCTITLPTHARIGDSVARNIVERLRLAVKNG
jgi:dTDP-4-amino-4,6-dideoxygalactose transaminase